jgi:hypothetical protein
LRFINTGDCPCQREKRKEQECETEGETWEMLIPAGVQGRSHGFCQNPQGCFAPVPVSTDDPCDTKFAKERRLTPARDQSYKERVIAKIAKALLLVISPDCVVDVSLVPGTCLRRFLDLKGLINKFLERAGQRSES